MGASGQTPLRAQGIKGKPTLLPCPCAFYITTGARSRFIISGRRHRRRDDSSNRGRPAVATRVLLALELLKHELGAADEQICHRLRTDFAVMYACGITEVQADPTQAHFVLPEVLAQFRSRIDAALMDELLAIQAATAMDEGLVSPAHLLVDTFPAEQGSQRVTDATTLYKAQKKSSSSLRPSRRKAPR